MDGNTECGRCGSCCRGTLIVEADWLDVLREPKILEADVTGLQTTIDELLDETRCVLLAGNVPCKFLGEDHRCTIYSTRPNDCVGMQADDEQCHEARRKCGLEPRP